MSKLGLIDQFFYKLETSGMSPMVMGGAMILDPTGSPFPLDGKALAEHLAARMERIPIMRKKLVQDPLGIGSMRLVDDPDFNVRNHITLTRIEAPGGYRELTDCLGTLSAQRLDLNRPLWHYEVIEGLAGGGLAVATHLHHSILDGIGAVEALSGIFNLEPVPAERPKKDAWQVEQTPTPFALLKDAVMENVERIYVTAPTFIWQSATPVLKALLGKLARVLGQREETERSTVAVPEVRKTSINVSRVSAKRVISYVELPINEVRALSRHFGCSINDLTILFNSYAMQHYFRGIGEKIDFDLVVVMPISVRRSEDKSAGNVLTAGRLSMHNRIANIEQRLRAIAADTTLIKRKTKPEHAAKPAVDSNLLMGLFSPIVLDALFYSVVRLKLRDRLALCNVGVTNVPGPPVPMYMAGARQVGMVPMAPVIDTVGLTICVSSSDTHLAMGYHGCGEAIRNKELFVEGALNAFNALKKAAGFAPAAAPAKAARRASRKPVASRGKPPRTAPKSPAARTAPGKRRSTK